MVTILDAAILGVASALAGCLGSIGQSLRKPFHAGRFDRSRLPVAVHALEAAGWIAFLAVLVLVIGRARIEAALLPMLAPALLMRTARVEQRLDLMEPGELVQLAFATTLGLGTCTLALAKSWLERPPASAAPGLAGLVGHALPLVAFSGAIAAALIALRQKPSAREARRMRAETRRAGGPRPVEPVAAPGRA
jgi:hypothetical protein